MLNSITSTFAWTIVTDWKEKQLGDAKFLLTCKSHWHFELKLMGNTPPQSCVLPTAGHQRTMPIQPEPGAWRSKPVSIDATRKSISYLVELLILFTVSTSKKKAWTWISAISWFLYIREMLLLLINSIRLLDSWQAWPSYTSAVQRCSIFHPQFL